MPNCEPAKNFENKIWVGEQLKKVDEALLHLHLRPTLRTRYMITDALLPLVVPKFPRISSRFLWILGCSFVALLLAFYIFQISEITKAGFAISNHEKQIAEFSQESQLLNADFSLLNSLANLETVLSNLDYEKVGQVHYLRVPGSTVVAK